MFNLHSISDTFIQADPETWITNQDYLKSEETLCALRVTNDSRERNCFDTGVQWVSE